jgi:hypothetical protein
MTGLCKCEKDGTVGKVIMESLMVEGRFRVMNRI